MSWHKSIPISGISAGFPSPADDFIELSIDLNKELIKNKDTTFFAKVKGHSMKNAGINDGDLLVIDRSLEPQNNKIAVCQIDGALSLLKFFSNESKEESKRNTPLANTFFIIKSLLFINI